MSELLGGCRCGAVRYALALDGLPPSYACHCRDCQTWSGSAFSQQAFLPEASLSVTGPLAAYEQTTNNITLTITTTRATESIVLLSSSLPTTATIPASVTIAANTGSTSVPVTVGLPGTSTVTATLGTPRTGARLVFGVPGGQMGPTQPEHI